jgi:hypothetical protein
MDPTLCLNFFPQIQIGMYTRKQKRKQKGGQPLSYTNPNYSEPSALPGSPILHSAGTIARPEIAQRGGTQRFYTDIGQWVPWTERGAPLVIQPQAGGQPLSYTNPEYREVSALPGAPLLESNGTVARPEIAQRGGFTPSIMTNLVGNAAYLTPLAMTAAYRLWSNRQTRKQYGGNGDEWEMYKQQAKGMLQGIAPGKANVKWISKLAKLLKEKKNTAAALEEFAQNKGVELKAAARPRFATKLNEWEYNQRQAKKELVKYGEPTAVEVTHLAALRTGRKGKEGNAEKYIEDFRQRQQAKKNAAVAEERDKEEKRIQKQIREAAKLVEAPKVARAPRVRVEKPKLVFNERPWEEIRKEAKDELYAMKKVMKRGNVMKYASMKRLKNQDRQQKFLDEFRARANAPEAKPSRESTPEPTSESNEEFRVDRVEPAKRKRKTFKKGREEWEAYQSGARRMLERIGPATIAEISTLAKMMKHGENVRPYLNDFETRVKRTAEREAGLEREREERERGDGERPPSREQVVAVVGHATPPPPPPPAPVAKPREELPPPPPAPFAAAAAKPARPIGQGEFAYFRQRMAELAKKYPAPK